MHVMIINGSPRVEKYSNTDKIIDAFTDGLTAENTCWYHNDGPEKDHLGESGLSDSLIGSRP